MNLVFRVHTMPCLDNCCTCCQMWLRSSVVHALQDLYLNADTLRSLSASRNNLRPAAEWMSNPLSNVPLRNLPNYLRRFQVLRACTVSMGLFASFRWESAAATPMRLHTLELDNNMIEESPLHLQQAVAAPLLSHLRMSFQQTLDNCQTSGSAPICHCD